MRRKEYQPDPVRVVALDDLVNKGAWPEEWRELTLREDREIALRSQIRRDKVKKNSKFIGASLALTAILGGGIYGVGKGIESFNSDAHSVKTEGTIGEMRVGDSGWVNDWAMVVYENNKKVINESYEVFHEKGDRNAFMLVAKTGKGYEVKPPTCVFEKYENGVDPFTGASPLIPVNKVNCS